MSDPMTAPAAPNHDPQSASTMLGDEAFLVVPLSVVDARMLPLVGGKAAALGGLLRAEFPVPDGFCVTTSAYTMMSRQAGLEPLLESLATTGPAETARLEELAAQARAALLEAPMPAPLMEAIGRATRSLQRDAPDSPDAGTGLAVRSSATAEDLPWASFAGQQETFLNVVGSDALLDAVRRCFASLWTDRAVTYRANLGIDPRAVRLAVVVQRLVDAAVAGVLFTANPLTGKRREVVIEANPGLGEAVVSGATTPDHFVVALPSGEIVDRRLGDKRLLIRAQAGGGVARVERPAMSAEASLSDAQIRALAALGARVEGHTGAPQDIEWALDSDGRSWLLQARAITTLYPLPPEAPASDETLRVYLCFGVQQGTTRPFTPMGVSAIRLLASGLTSLVGQPPADRLRGPGFVVEGGSRVFLDVTRALRSGFWRRFLAQMMAEAEVHAAAGFERLVTDPRLSLLPARRWRVARAVMRLMVRTGMPWYLAQALLFPQAAQARVGRIVRQARQLGKLKPQAAPSERLDACERLLSHDAPRLLPRVSPVMVAGMQAFGIARRLLGKAATEEELQVTLRGSPTNSTVQMNLALWALAERVAADPVSAHLLQQTSRAELATLYRAGRLPDSFQQGLTAFLVEWGHHAVAELDVGLPRWSEDPETVLGVLAGYLGSGHTEVAPRRQIERMGDEAEAMVRALTSRARAHGWARGWLVGFCLRRARALSGYRETPRFVAALLLTQARAHLEAVGDVVARAGRLERAADIFFLTLSEARTALAGESATDWRALTRERRERYDEELARRHVPLILLSDGTEPAAASAGQHEDQQPDSEAEPSASRLKGTPASPGMVTGVARVIRDPAGARLEPGEILVAPSTDPGWTPLFLTAAGLVMELGGAMAHGAIVAREYGLPAVVGVSHATERITTGQRITVDGAAGVVTLESAADAAAR